MKKILLLLLFLSVVNLGYSQKLYVWCQKDQIPTPRPNFLADKEIDLVIFDARAMTPKSRVKCEGEEVVDNIIGLIRETYPDATFNVLNSDEFFKEPADGKLTLKVGLAAFHAAFGADVKIGIGSVGGSFAWGAMPEGEWNALTGYSVTLYVYENGNKTKEKKDIAKVASRPNTGGYITARNILNKTYIEANQEMFFFIDELLMK